MMQKPVELKGRELEVINLMRAGHRPYEVAKILGIHRKTVACYLSRIKGRVGAKTMFCLGVAVGADSSRAL